jgi:hypothetical protein
MNHSRTSWHFTAGERSFSPRTNAEFTGTGYFRP